MLTKLPRQIYNELQQMTDELTEFAHNVDAQQLFSILIEGCMERYIVCLERFTAELWMLLIRLNKTHGLIDTDVSGMLCRLESTPTANTEIQRLEREDEFSMQFVKVQEIHLNIQRLKTHLQVNDQRSNITLWMKSNGESIIIAPCGDHRVANLWFRNIVLVDGVERALAACVFRLMVDAHDLLTSSRNVVKQQRRTTHTHRLYENIKDEWCTIQTSSRLRCNDKHIENDICDMLVAHGLQHCACVMTLKSLTSQNRHLEASVMKHEQVISKFREKKRSLVRHGELLLQNI